MSRWVAACVWALAMLACAPAAAQPIAVRVERLSPATIHVPLGAVHPEPLRFRVVRASDGAPLQGVDVHIFVNVIFCLPLLPCPYDTPGYFGEFVSDAPTFTGPDGIVESSLFRAGTQPGTYEIIAWPAFDQGYSFSFSAANRVVVDQFEWRATIPAGSGVSLALLVALVVTFALRRHGRTASR